MVKNYKVIAGEDLKEGDLVVLDVPSGLVFKASKERKLFLSVGEKGNNCSCDTLLNGHLPECPYVELKEE